MVTKKSPIPTMRHCNNNPLAAISIVTSGPTPGYHEIVQIGVVVSDDWMQYEKTVVPFYFTMRPSLPDRFVNRMNVSKFMKAGEEPYSVANLFVDWFDSLRLPDGKQLELVCHDAPKLREFLRHWLFDDDFNRMISPRIRDTAALANYMNDRACFTRREYPCPKPLKLNHLSTQFGVANDQRGDALHDALATLETYRRMVGTQL